MKKDIEGRADIEQLIQSFYAQLQEDELIGFIFTEAVKLDFDEHIPIICDFWESVLFGRSLYQGNVMLKHIDLDKKAKLLPEHFQRWQDLFLKEIEETFEGTVADEMVRRTKLMMPLMQFKVESSRDQGFIQ